MPASKKKLNHGEGSVFQRSNNGLWVGTLALPMHDGSRRRKSVSGKTETIVREKLAAIRRELMQHGDIPTGGETLEQWMNLWYRDIVLPSKRPKTAATYRTMVEQYIIPSIGKVRLDKLTPAHVRQLATFIERKGLSSSTAMQAHRVLAVALKYAEREGRVRKNVATLTDAPRKAARDLTVLTAADGIRLLQSVAGDRLGSRWAAALLTGARQGELLGLELTRVTDVLDLSWQMQRLPWKHGCGDTCSAARGAECPKRWVEVPRGYEKRHLRGGLWLVRPKSSAGWRIIPLVEPLRSIIDRRVETAASEPNPHGLVWTNPDGSPIDPSRDNAAWHQILAAAELPDARLHDARHTTVDLLYEAGVSEPIIQEIVGHSTVSMSRAYKSRGNRDQLSAAMTALSAQLSIAE
ncbi:tyrosine-type recombinase/integrase [Glaciibacter flavus]|uniref:tyrosine-type recombinase/integrase n=1 Tax=Orlajensenia flava TaxID=2565934 RepID=UPI003B0010DF